MPTFMERLQHGWNAFINNKDPTITQPSYSYGNYSYRQDRHRIRIGNERTIINSIYNRIATDCSSIDIGVEKRIALIDRFQILVISISPKLLLRHVIQ